MSAVLPTLLLLSALQVKHVLADFYLQSYWMVKTKGIYGHPGGLAHAGLHMAFSALVLVWFGLSWALLAALLAGEFVVHYHTDWLKDRLVRRGGFGPADARFWNLTGVDQFVHQMTYLGLVALTVSAGVSQ